MVDARVGDASLGSVRVELPANRARFSAKFSAAVRDAAAATAAALEASGARLGAVKIVDPTARVCRTDVLAGWPSDVGSTRPTDVDADAAGAPPPPPAPAQEVIVTGTRRPAGPPPRVTLQPPVQSLQDEGCVYVALL